jgi:hypothetical protein
VTPVRPVVEMVVVSPEPGSVRVATPPLIVAGDVGT